MRRRYWEELANDLSWALLMAAGIHAVVTETFKVLGSAAILLVGTHVITSSIKARRVVRMTEAEGKIEKKKENENEHGSRDH